METARTSVSQTPVLPVTPGVFASSASAQNGRWKMTLRVDNIHCARCIWAIESALQKEPDVTHARVNMSTGRLALEWEGDAARADELAALVASLGYGVKPFTPMHEQTSDESRQLLRSMAVAGFAMGNIMLLSVALWSSSQEVMGLATRELFHLLSAAIALPAIAYAGRPFFRSAWSVLKQGRTNMDVPISLALILATGMSIAETLRQGEHAYFDSAVMLMFFLLVGRWLDARARGKARETAQGLLNKMQGYTTRLLENGREEAILIKELEPGMQIRIKAGETVPADAKILIGSTELDTSLVTGESIPRAVSEGDEIHSGTLNLSAPITCEVLRASEDSLLADIIRLMEQAEQGRARYVRLADRAARLYTPVVHMLAAGAFFGWWLVGGLAWQDALLIAITTLIITCPCALGLAVPVVQVLASSWLMKRGILVKAGDALERLTHITTIIWDKTGTLTRGQPALLSQPDQEQCITLAVALARHSTHPLAVALASAHTSLSTPLISEVKEIPGMGMQAEWQAKRIQLGRRSWCGDAGAPEDTVQELWFALEGEAPQRFTFSDALYKDAPQVLRKFHESGIRSQLLSGDRHSAVSQVAQQLELEHFRAECKPGDKVQQLKELRNVDALPLMVGDGLNDAPALASAHISLSPASGADISQNAADIVYQPGGVKPVYLAWRMARFSDRLVKQNFALAILYNCIAIPIALMGLVTPLIAAIAMSSSSLLVVCNAFRINLEHGWED